MDFTRPKDESVKHVPDAVQKKRAALKNIAVEANARMDVPSWEALAQMVEDDGSSCAHLVAAACLRLRVDQLERDNELLRERLEDLVGLVSR